MSLFFNFVKHKTKTKNMHMSPIEINNELEYEVKEILDS